jgi:hypothetical protein
MSSAGGRITGIPDNYFLTPEKGGPAVGNLTGCRLEQADYSSKLEVTHWKSVNTRAIGSNPESCAFVHCSGAAARVDFGFRGSIA